MLYLNRFVCWILLFNKQKMLKIFLFALFIFGAISSNFQPRTQAQVAEGFKRYDVNANGLLSLTELKRYFDDEYMRTFQGIDIDPKFVEASFEYLKSFDIDKNGHTLEQLIKGVIPEKNNEKKSKQPQHYAQQQL